MQAKSSILVKSRHANSLQLCQPFHLYKYSVVGRKYGEIKTMKEVQKGKLEELEGEGVEKFPELYWIII